MYKCVCARGVCMSSLVRQCVYECICEGVFVRVCQWKGCEHDCFGKWLWIGVFVKVPVSGCPDEGVCVQWVCWQDFVCIYMLERVCVCVYLCVSEYVREGVYAWLYKWLGVYTSISVGRLCMFMCANDKETVSEDFNRRRGKKNRIHPWKIHPRLRFSIEIH